MNIYYGVTNYHRPEIKTLKTLEKIGVPPERVIITLNDLNDAEECERRYGAKYKIIAKEGRNVACNRNTILDYYPKGEVIIVLDDDVIAFKTLARADTKSGVKLKAIETAERLENIFRSCATECIRQRKRLFGGYPVPNEMFMLQAIKRDGKYSRNKIWAGGLTGFINSDLRLDESYDLEEDYEIQVREISTGRGTLRRNDISADHNVNNGGCNERYVNGEQPAMLRKLQRQYPNLVSVKKNNTGIVLKRAREGQSE